MKVKLHTKKIAEWLLVVCLGITAIYNVKVAGHAISYYLYFAFIIIAAIAIIKNQPFILNGKLLESALPLLILMLMSILWAPSLAVIRSNYSSFYICAIFIIFAQSIGIESKYLRISKALCALGGIAIAIYMLFASGSGLTHNNRMYLMIGGTTIETNYLNYLFIFPTVFCIDTFVRKKTNLIEKLVLIISTGILIFVVISTGSRGGLLAILLGGAVTYYFSGKNSGKPLRVIWTTIIVVALVVILLPYIKPLLPQTLLDRFSPSEVVSDGGNGRIDIWKNAMTAIREQSDIFNLFFGHGFLSSIAILGTTLHNAFIEILFDQGLIGAILFLVMNIKLIYMAFIAKDPQMIGLVIGQIVLSMTLAGVISRYFWINYLILILIYEHNFIENTNKIQFTN